MAKAPKPPAKLPYVFQEFPGHVYKENSRPLVVRSKEEKDKALASGWQVKPFDETTVISADTKVALDKQAKDFDDGWRALSSQLVQSNAKLDAAMAEIESMKSALRSDKKTSPSKEKAGDAVPQ